MKKWSLLILVVICLSTMLNTASAQCSICTKTAMQQGEKPASALNSAIVYLMMAPFAVAGFVGYRWYKSQLGKD
jgi:hypothetical protein